MLSHHLSRARARLRPRSQLGAARGGPETGGALKTWRERAEAAEQRIAELERDATTERENYQSLGQNWNEAEERAEAAERRADDEHEALEQALDMSTHIGEDLLEAQQQLQALKEAARALVESFNRAKSEGSLICIPSDSAMMETLRRALEPVAPLSPDAVSR